MIVYSGDIDGGIFAANADGTGSKDLTPGRASDGFPSVSPDGTRIAFTYGGKSEDEDVIAVMNADGSGRTAIPPYGWSPVWSPDGALIAFAGEGVFSDDIFVVHPDGSGLRRVASDAPNFGIAWSPDSRLIAYGGSAGLTTVDMSSGARKVLARLPGSWRPAWSPDGSQIAFDDGDGNVRVVTRDGSNLRSTHAQTGSETPSWSSDGTRLAVGDQSREPERVVVIDAKSGVKTQLTTSRFGESSGDPQWSSDGRIAFLRTQWPEPDLEFTSTTGDVWVMDGDGSRQVRVTSPFPTGVDAGELHWLSGMGTVVPDAPVRTVAALPTRGFVTKTEQWLAAADGRSVYMYGAQGVTKWSTPNGVRRTIKPEMGRVGELAVTAAHLTWLCYLDSHDGYARTLETAASFGSTPVKLMHVGSTLRDPMELAGASSLVVYTAHARLWRLHGLRSSLIRRIAGEVVRLATDGRVIAVVHRHSIDTLRPSGADIHAFPFSPEDWRSVRVTNGRLVVVRGSTISVYRAAGAREHSWEIGAPGPPAELVDARGRYAVYTAGIALRLLDLRNGRDVAIGLQNQVGAATAIFTARGLAYVYPVG